MTRRAGVTVTALLGLLVALPAVAEVGALARASGLSPFSPGCHGATQAGTLSSNSEVEPWIDVNPTDPANLIGVYQQDRFSTGGASGLGTSVSRDGGASWSALPVGALPTFSRCAGAAPGSVGDYERATDPWVTFTPSGTAYQMSLSFNDTRNLHNAMLVSTSTDGGHSWGPPQELIVDTNPTVFNDKNSMTADPHEADFVYAVWDRLVFPNERARGVSHLTTAAFEGPTYFTRTTDDGATWEMARSIFNPGRNDQTIGNQIAVLGDGTLVNIMTVFRNDRSTGRQGGTISVLRSADRGATWSGEIVLDRLGTVGVRDPRDGAPVRTGDIIPSIAADERDGHDEVYAVWQDARWNGFVRDQIAFSRSVDGGRTWTPPVRINSAPSSQAFTPAVRVDDRGNIAVLHYDFRHDTTASPSLDTDVWALFSNDGGRTWREERVTPTSFDMRAAPSARGFFVGDYIGLGATGRVFTPFFSASSLSASALGTDTFSTSFSPPFLGAVVIPEPAPAALSAAAFPDLRGRPTPR